MGPDFDLKNHSQEPALGAVSRFRDIAQAYGVRRSSISEIQKAIGPQLVRRDMRTPR
jgi:hypothetical protein